MQRRWMAVLAAVVLSFDPAAHADLGFPDSVKFPPQIRINPDQALQKEDFGEAEFAIDKSGKKATYRGARHARWFAYVPAQGEPAPGYYNGTEERIGKAVQGALLREGWQVVWQEDNKSGFSMKLDKGGKVAWVMVKMDAPQAQVFVETVEIGQSANQLALVPPAAKPETFGDKDDIPYLAPYPGSTRKGEGRGDSPMDVSLPGSGDEVRLAGTGTQVRTYQGPSTLSKLQFMNEYRAALTAAGWTLVFPDDKRAPNESQIIARYTKNGRDVWARLHYEFGASLSFTVADAGAEDWAAKLKKDCKVPLYGVYFDFNKATIKPESEPVLTKAASLLKAVPGNFEVRGHTDAVGGEESNLKLAEARAASVRTWLTGRGIDGVRLGAKGFGKSQPVADNGTAEGRAKNRRVELVQLQCAAK